MKRYDYLIVGGGMAADAAVRGIRERDGSGTIGLITAEPHPPYSRPPLTKALWKGEPEGSIWRGSASFGVRLHLGTRAVGLEPGLHRVTDASGEEYGYGRLLLATGGRPRRLAGADEDVIAFRYLDDYRRLREAATPGSAVVVLGGGFIGSELAASLSAVGAAVSLVVPEPAVGARVFPADLANAVTDLYRARAIDVRTNDLAESVTREGTRLVVRTRSGAVLEADAVVAGLGIEPDTALAAAGGVTTDNGIAVDLRLRTSHPDVFAAGDVASVFSPALGRRRRVEHEDAALTMGLAAGRSMAGDASEYTHLPFFYSDLFELGYEAVGDLDSRLSTSAEWKEPFREGIVHYRRQGRVVGVLLWNVWGQVDSARELVSGAAVASS